MPANDPCAAERKSHYNASVEFSRADQAYDDASEPEVMPLVREWSKTNLQISRLKKNGDPEGLLQNLQTLQAERLEKIEEAQGHPAVKNTLHSRTLAKDKMDHLASKLRDCEKKHETPSSPEPATPPASADPDAPTNDSARKHIPGEWYRP